MPRDRLQSNPLMTTEMLSAALPSSALRGTITETEQFCSLQTKTKQIKQIPNLAREKREAFGCVLMREQWRLQPTAENN